MGSVCQGRTSAARATGGPKYHPLSRMSDPVLALVLIVSFIAALAAASYFRTLDSSLGRDSRLPFLAGAVAGVLIHFVPGPIATGIILTVAALYVRLMGRESEPADGMTLGAMTGTAAAIPLVLLGDAELLRFTECILA